MTEPRPPHWFAETDERRTGRACDHPGCLATGCYRAPKDRARLTDYFWFCLEHVRSYNRSWNYHAGMSQEDIEREVRNDTVWRRPTWPLHRGPAATRTYCPQWRDDLGLFEAARQGAHGGTDDRNQSVWHFTGEERQALDVLSLEVPLTLTTLKRRYKELVKKLHPDANGGDRLAEDRLKDINRAYATLRKSMTA